MSAATPSPSATNALTAVAAAWFWVKWVVASAVPWPLYIVMHERYVPGDMTAGAGIGLQSVFLLPVGMLTGLLQALVLGRYVANVWAWPMDAIVGWALGLSVAALVTVLASRSGVGVLAAGSPGSVVLVCAIVGGVLGVFQRRTLQQGLPSARTWLLLSPLAWAIAGLAAMLLSVQWTGAVFGAITGAWLARVLPEAARQRGRSPS